MGTDQSLEKQLSEMIWGNVDAPQLLTWDMLILPKDQFVRPQARPLWWTRCLSGTWIKEGYWTVAGKKSPSKAGRYVDDREHTTGMPSMPLPGDR